MTIKSAVWTVGTSPQPLGETKISSEQLLEDMIVAAPKLLSDDWMLIGRQEDTGYGGRIDLLAIAPDGSLVLIELKRDKTPRDVVAQAIDYASWVATLGADDIQSIYNRFAPQHHLADDFKARFGVDLVEETLNESHQMVIVAASLDASTERIVEYLNERGIPINILCFQVFKHGEGQLISRTWLIDPSAAAAPVATATKQGGVKEPWNGETYCSFGDDSSRSWEEAREHGFVSGGGGDWYTNTLKSLKVGDRIWVNVPKKGYVGVGVVTGLAQPASAFELGPVGEKKPALQVLTKGDYYRDKVDDLTECEYFAPVRWLDALPLSGAVKELGFFGNQNTVCKPTTPAWRTTVEKLKVHFPHWADK